MDEKVKKKTNSKNKGNANERKIASILSTELPPLKFIKTPGSGAFLGGRNFASREKLFAQNMMNVFVGDIVCTNEDEANLSFDWVIEAKHYKTPDSFDSLFTGKHKVYGWMNEVAIDCIKVNKKGIVIFKFNNTPHFCAVDKSIQLPKVKTIILPDGSQLCYFLELLQHKDFWFTAKT